MQFEKPSLPVPDQIALLKVRGMGIANDERAARVLRYINYYRLRAYWLPFEFEHFERPNDLEHAFKPGTEFDHIVALYVFDRRLRILLLEGIERVEIAIRTQWSQVIAERYGAHGYLNEDVFSNRDQYATCLRGLDDELKRSKETFVKHYREKYSEPSRPPIWAISELLTLGQLSKWLGNTKLRADRQVIAQRLGIDEVVLCAFAHHLTHVRNLCAHHSRVWNRKLTITMSVPKQPVQLASWFNRTNDRRIFNTLVMLVWCFEQISPTSAWRERLRKLLSERNPEELASMGAFADWRNRAPWNF